MEHKFKYLSFGALFRLFFEQQLDTVSSERMMTELVRNMASDFERNMGSGLLRIKAFLKCPTGYIKADVTGVKKGVFVESTVKERTKRAELAINIVTQELEEEEVEAIALGAIEKTLTPLNGRFSPVKTRKNAAGPRSRVLHV